MGELDAILGILSNKKVLYAEDEKGIRENVSEILQLFFEKVVVADNGLSVLEEIEFGNFDMFIFDICMPHIDGLEIIQKIRQKD
jgi:CheY-like chemotaxis protein